MDDFHKGDCGGHLFWKLTANKILRVGYYWPTLFADVYKLLQFVMNARFFKEGENCSLYLSSQSKLVLCFSSGA